MDASLIQSRFVELLLNLSEAGKAEWVQSEDESGFVYCLVSGELVVFELHGANGTPIAKPTERVSGIVGKCRNVSFLWLEVSPGWGELVDLLKSAPVDSERFVEFRQRAHSSPVTLLEIALQQ